MTVTPDAAMTESLAPTLQVCRGEGDEKKPAATAHCPDTEWIDDPNPYDRYAYRIDADVDVDQNAKHNVW